MSFSAPFWHCFLHALHESLLSALSLKSGSETGVTISDLVCISVKELFETTCLSLTARPFYFNFFSGLQHR